MPAAIAIALAVMVWIQNAVAEPAASSYVVALRAQVSVKSTTLVLADVADVSGDDAAAVARLAAAPLGSITNVRLLSRGEVLYLIRSVIPNPDAVSLAGADFVKVVLETRTPEAAEIAAVLKAHLVAITTWSEEEIDIRSIDNLSILELPQGNVQLRVANRTVPANFRQAMLPVAAVLEGKRLRTFWLKADVRVHARVVRVLRPVPYGRALQIDDLEEAACEIENPRLDHFRTAVEAVGMTAKRSLAPGDLLDRGAVNEGFLVHSGDAVRLLAQSRGMKITVLARSLQNGRMGDRIKVRNIDSDRVISATVTGVGEVRIVQ